MTCNNDKEDQVLLGKFTTCEVKGKGYYLVSNAPIFSDSVEGKPGRGVRVQAGGKRMRATSLPEGGRKPGKTRLRRRNQRA